VEKILKRRRYRRKVEYLVAWKGYPLHEATWEAESSLKEDVPDMIAEFMDSGLNQH
jgi:hypothetical protein